MDESFCKPNVMMWRLVGCTKLHLARTNQTFSTLVNLCGIMRRIPMELHEATSLKVASEPRNQIKDPFEALQEKICTSMCSLPDTTTMWGFFVGSEVPNG